MRVVCFRTNTYDCDSRVYSLQSAGHDLVAEIDYNHPSITSMQPLVERARQLNPDFIVFVGVHPEGYQHPYLTFDAFRAFRSVAPTAFICCDASDDPWWGPLLAFYEAGCFTVIVSIDGGDNPVKNFENGVSILSCNDQRPFLKFRDRPWKSRSRKLAFSGGLGSPKDQRVQVMRDLERDVLDFHQGCREFSYDDMARFYCDHKFVVNFPWASEGRHTHVKGRCLEAGYSHCVLFEHESSPLKNWYEPNKDYIAYKDADDCRRWLREFSDDAFEAMADRWYDLMNNERSPKNFWDAVLKKMGLIP